MRAVRKRRGFTVALIGCDGAGKTTVARSLPGALGERPVRYLYMGVSADSSNRLLPTTRVAHAVKRARGERSRARSGLRRSVRSAARLANRLAEEWYRQVLALAYLRGGAVVVFDRHFLADFHASDVEARGRSLSRRLHGLALAHLYPKPELVIFLDARPEVLYARKGEGTPESLAALRADYHRLGEVTEHFRVVWAEQPLETVVEEVTGVISAFGAAR